MLAILHEVLLGHLSLESAAEHTLLRIIELKLCNNFGFLLCSCFAKNSAFSTLIVSSYVNFILESQINALCLKASLPGMLVHPYNPRIREAEAEGSWQIKDQLGLQSEFKVSLNCIARHCLEKIFKKLKKCHTISKNQVAFNTLVSQISLFPNPHIFLCFISESQTS